MLIRLGWVSARISWALQISVNRWLEFQRILGALSTEPLRRQKGLAGSPAPTREAMHIQAQPQTIIVDQIVDHFLPLDMNDEAQLTFVLGT